MNEKSNKLVAVGLISAISASICCIAPVFALVSGVSGLASTFSWLEPFRFYLIGITTLVLGIAWYIKLKPKSADKISCDCEENEKSTFLQSKIFLGFISLFTITMLLFPYYGQFFYPKQNKQAEAFSRVDLKEITFSIKGMTCTSCESHVIHAVNQLPGIKSVLADHKKGKAIIKFYMGQTSVFSITSAIKSTGYEITNTTLEDNSLLPVIESKDCETCK